MSEGHEYDIEELRRLVAEDAGCPEFPALAEAERRAGHPQEAQRISEEGLAAAPGRLAGRVSLGLALLELGQGDSAVHELAGILDSVLEPHVRSAPADAPGAALAEAPQHAFEPVATDEVAAALVSPAVETGSGPAFDDAVGDAELEEAFASAEPQVEDMFSANKMAEQVLMDHAMLEGEEAEDLEMGSSSAYSTETMADLLERQGDQAGAEAIRRSLDAGPAPGDGFLTPGADAARAPVEPAPAGAERDEAERSRILGTFDRWLRNIQRGTA